MSKKDPREEAAAIGVVADPERVTAAEVERFLYDDAALLDDWRYDVWTKLLTDDATYEIPAMDRPAGERGKVMCIIADDHFRILARCRQLAEGRVLAESPRSRTRRQVTNVRIVENRGAELQVAANFAIYRMRHDHMETFVGSYDLTLAVIDGRLRLRHRRSILDSELRPHGKLTIIL